jgi:hypothetical protein
MKINIFIASAKQQYSVFADDETKEFKISSIEFHEGVEDFVRRTIDIVKDWPDVCEDPEIQDGIHYRISYNDGKTDRQLIGINDTPDNFSALINLIENKLYPDKSQQRKKIRFIEKQILSDRSENNEQ